MGRQELRQIIEDAVKKEKTSFDLKHNKLRELPLNIGQLTNLRSLDLSWNELSQLPPEIGQLTNLQLLVLRDNQLSDLPPEIGQLTNLQELDLRNNQLSQLPPEIGQLTNLQWLHLDSNQLSQLPPEIGQLTNLQVLVLRDNQLSALPPEIGQLTNLQSLVLDFNQLSQLPSEIGQLTNLHSLVLIANQLSQLPPEIGQLTDLESLILNFNRLSQLPPEIGQLTNLQSLDLNINPLEIPPPEIVKGGIRAIASYFEQLEREGAEYLYEAKLLIVGEGEAGKTSLARKIEDQDYQLQLDEASTEGIDIIQWHFPLPQQDRDFLVNIWDFGGQEIYHATHQFFLTKRSLYALVVDNRKEHTDLYYWLNVVDLLSDGSPLLIIQNEKDDRSVEMNIRELRGQFDNLKETLPTNLKTNRGLDNILSQLEHYLSNLPHVGDRIPKPWLKVRQALEASEYDYISLADYLATCNENGLKRTEDQLQLSGYMHDLGVCLHFQNDFILKNIVILKPTWGTDAVYRVLDNEQVINNQGCFNQDDLALIWAEEKYAAKQPELLQLMMNFKLCYPLADQPGWYIAPHLLTKNKPDYDWDEADNLLLRYEYKFMPKGIITRFIVMMHHYIEQQSNVWQSGVILAKDNTRAEVIEYYDQRELTIRVAGRHKRDFLTNITYELDKIHQSYSRLNYNKLVPCNCSQCKDSQQPYFYKFESLQRRLSAGVNEIECDISFKMVNVRSLIDDVGEQVSGLNQQRRDDLQQLLITHQRRLQKFLEQKAEMGLHTPPYISTQIDSTKAEIEQLQYELDGLR